MPLNDDARLARTQAHRALVDATAHRYRPAGRFAYFFARGKLSRDPLFATLLDEGLVPDATRLVDLGCGQGLLGAWLDSARALHDAAPDDASRAQRPAPPRVACYVGVDRSPAELARARHALPATATLLRADLAQVDAATIGGCDVVTLFDVLHYLEPAAQSRLLAVVRDCLVPAGVLVLRIGDATDVRASRIDDAVDSVVARLRGHPGRLHRRTLAGWRELLAGLGYATRVVGHDSDRDVAASNVLLVARPVERAAGRPLDGAVERVVEAARPVA